MAVARDEYPSAFTVNCSNPTTGPSVALTTLVPRAEPLAKPAGVILTKSVMLGVDETLQVTCEVMSCWVPFDSTPRACNWRFDASGSNAVGGLIVIATSSPGA